jgi:hypothetical protein
VGKHTIIIIIFLNQLVFINTAPYKELSYVA